jgi:SRSO17 transposase
VRIFSAVEYDLKINAQHRLDEYLAEIGEVLGHKKRRASFALYFLGLLSESERKSIEPIAARLCPEPAEVSAVHQQLQHFVTDSEWNDRAVRRVAARRAIAAMSEHEPVRLWIIDDTGFIKQGKHSVGVQRQYTGTAGKVTNCQVGVSLSVATSTAHAPIDFELYLPECWANDPTRRDEAKIPAEVVFKTKPQLALDMIVRALEDDLPGEVVLADADYGDRPFFRDSVRAVGLDYAVGVRKTTRVRLVDKRGRPYGQERTVHQLATALGASAFRRLSWREGTAGPLFSRFAFRRVKEMHGDDGDVREREAEWLLIEWPDGEPEPTKYSLSTLPKRMGKTQLVRLLKERYRTERAYQELKGELGLDHFEGRRFRGWHHHVSVALCCYAFVVTERVRHFPPSAARSAAHDAHRFAA